MSEKLITLDTLRTFATKLSSIFLTGATVNGVNAPVEDGIIQITVPERFSDLTFDVISAPDSAAAQEFNTAVSTIVNNIVGDTVSELFVFVDRLPDVGEAGKLYFVPATATDESTVADNAFIEYAWNTTHNVWEKIGEYKADITLDYATADDIDALFE